MIQATLHPGTFIASDGACYHVLDTIATGGYSTIYKAIRQDTKEVVAIKTITFNDPDYPKLKNYFLNCFEQEIKTCSELSHPNVVALVNRGYLNPAEPFAVYAFIDGMTLNDFIFQHGPLSGTMTKSVMQQILEALLYLHQQGIIHSDLKPQNIMLTSTANSIHVTILDLGSSIKLNYTIKQDDISTLFNLHVLATANYCSPEQLSGTLAGVKSDIYAWGLILIECLTGQPAIEGNTIAAVLKNQLNTMSVPIPAFITEQPLLELLSKILQKNSDDRLGDAVQIKEKLNDIAFCDSYSSSTAPLNETTIEGKITGIRKMDITKAASDIG